MPPLTFVLICTIALNLLVAWLLALRLFSFYSEAKKRRRRRFERRLSHFAGKPIADNDILFVGDSITEGADWQALFPNIPTRNFGIGSDTTAGVLERIGPIVDGRPKAIFLLIGTNDIGLGFSQTETMKNYALIVERIRSDSPKTRLYVQSILPRQAQQDPKVEALNAQLQKLATQHDIPYLNLYPHFRDETGGIHKTHSNDELHLLGSGYRLWQQQIATPVVEAAS